MKLTEIASKLDSLIPHYLANSFVQSPKKATPSDTLDPSTVFELHEDLVQTAISYTFAGHDIRTHFESGLNRTVRNISCTGATPHMVHLFGHLKTSKQERDEIVKSLARIMEETCAMFGVKPQPPQFTFDLRGGNETILSIVLSGMLKQKLFPTTTLFKNSGEVIYIIGEEETLSLENTFFSNPEAQIGVSVPKYDPQFDTQLSNTVRQLVNENMVTAACNVEKGGLLFALLKMITDKLGFDITTGEDDLDVFLFGEGAGRIVISVDPLLNDAVVDYLIASKLPFYILGHVTKGELNVDGTTIGESEKYLKEMYTNF